MKGKPRQGRYRIKWVRHWHKGIGLPGIIKFYRTFYKNPTLWLALIGGIAIAVFSMLRNSVDETFHVALELSLSILPSLLGLSLASLAIIGAMAVKDVVKKIEVRQKTSQSRVGFSFVLAVFSFAVSVHAVSLIVAVILSFAGLFASCFSNSTIRNVKVFAVFLQSFLLLYSLFVVCDLIPAMFTYGRLYVKVITEDVECDTSPDGKEK